MAISTAERKGIVDEVIAGIKNFLGVKPKNEADAATINAMQMESVDVDGGDPMWYDISDDSVPGVDIGDAVYSDEAMTSAYADGDYTLADGRAATVAAGVVSSLTDAASQDSVTNAADEALVAENAALKAENAANKLKITGLTNKLARVVPGGGNNPNPAGAAQNFGKKPNVGNSASPLPIRLTANR